MGEKIKIRTAADARRKFKTRELTASDVYKFLEESLADCNEDYVLNPAERLAPGVKEELERAGFTITVLPDAFIPTRTLTAISWNEKQQESPAGRHIPVAEADLIEARGWRLDNAEQARALSGKYGDKLDRLLYNVQEAAKSGRMSIEIPNITGTELEQELHDRGFEIRHFAGARRGYTQVSW